MKRIEALFITSVLFFLIAGLLYAWGPPAWFSRYPYSAGLRFLLALEAYFLCSSFFFALRSARLPRRGKHAYAASFIISFAAVPAFAALVLLDSPIQTVKAFVGVLDIAAWLSLALLAIARSERKRAAYYAVFAATGALLMIPPVPSILVIAARFSLLALYVITRFQSAPGRASASPDAAPLELGAVAERYALSVRETEILSLLVSGKTNREIAEILFISISTVKTHIASIFAKTGARNRLEASVLCRKN